MIGLILFSFSCKKKNIPVKLSPHTEQKIVAEGFITDSIQKQQFKFTLSNNIESDTILSANEVSLIVKTPDGVRSFSKIQDGVFESDEAFKGIYGEEYTIQFSYLGNVHDIKTKMPHPVKFNSFSFYQFSEDMDIFDKKKFLMNISSDVHQYVRYEIFSATLSEEDTDTTWVKHVQPIYQFLEITAEDSVEIKAPDLPFFPTKGLLVKIKTYLLSPQVAGYLSKLEKYLTNELSNKQFYNPPYYYSNHAYGLGYCTIVDSIIHQY